MEPAFVDRVRQASDIVEVIGEYVRLEKRGKDYWGLCPFHSEKSPSFSVAPDKQFFHCFGCQVNGSVIDFIQRRENVAFRQAVELLARRARIPIPQVERTPEEEAAFREREQLYGALELAARYFEHVLQEPAGQAAREYLERRGLEPETQRRFHLGYAPNGWDGLLRNLRGRHSEATLFKTGLLSRREGAEGFYDRFRDRIMFPITDVRGRIIGFGGRIMSGENVAKYLNTPETPLFNKRRTLYALHLARDAIRSSDQAIIVEGYMDAISAHQAGVTNVVASLGTALTAEQSKGLREQCSQVIIAYDADTAGQSATLRGLDLLVTAGCDVKVLRLPQGKDPDELIRTQGPEPFLGAVKVAVPLLEFKLRLAIERHANAGNAAERQSRVIADVLPILVTARDEVQRSQYVALIARALTQSAPEEAMVHNAILVELRRHLRSAARGSYKASRIVENISDVGAADAAARRPQAPDPYERAERLLLRALLQYPNLYPQVQAGLGPNPFTYPLLQQASAALDPAAAGESAVAGMLERLSDPAVRSFVAQLAMESDEIGDAGRYVADCITNIRKHRIQRRIDQLQKLIGERSAAGQEVADLLAEMMKLKVEINRNIK